MKKTVTVPTGWSEISLGTYERMMEVLANPALTNQEKEMAFVAVAAGMTSEDVASMDLDSFRSIRRTLAFMEEKPKPKHPVQTIDINGRRYRGVFDPARMTAAEFLDYKSILEHRELDRITARLLACFIIPEGHDYGDGYDVEELVGEIWDHMSVEEVTGFSDFFTVTCQSYVDAILAYSTRRLKRLKGMPTEERRRMLEQLRQARALLQSGGLMR